MAFADEAHTVLSACRRRKAGRVARLRTSSLFEVADGTGPYSRRRRHLVQK